MRSPSTRSTSDAIRHGRCRVVLGAHRENGAVHLEVADDGPGGGARATLTLPAALP